MTEQDGPDEDWIQKAGRALGSSVRREILWKVWDREMPVAGIASGLKVSAPTLSGHLAVLRDAGLVTMRPEGTTRLYRARPEGLARFRALLDDPAKWATAREHPEQERAEGGMERVVSVSADIGCTPEEVFRGFTDARIYAACVGGEVSLSDGQFSASVAGGQVVRGVYLLTSAPSLIVMEWDFGFEAVPAPGKARRAFLVIHPRPEGGARMEITQFIAAPAEAPYMVAAWRFVLGSFSERLTEALEAYPE